MQEAIAAGNNEPGYEYKSLWKDDFRTLDSKIDKLEVKLSRSIYLVGLVQFLAIVAAVVSIMSFMLRK